MRGSPHHHHHHGSAKNVVLDHDGNLDDFVAMVLLASNTEKVRLIGALCTDADCFVENGFNVTGKIMCLMHNNMNLPLFPIGKSAATAVNPFPKEWRCLAKNMDDMPILNIPENVELWDKIKAENEKYEGQQLLADLVMNSEEKVTICVTGPLSNVAWCIDKYGEKFTSKVEECVIMGGAVDVRGNVFLPSTDGTAEWNIYWDPASAKTVFGCPGLRRIMFSLDSTNTVPVRSPYVQRFGEQTNFLLSILVGTMWAMCTHCELLRDGDGYYAADALTAAYVVDQKVANVDPVPIDVVVDKQPNEGATVRTDAENYPLTFVARNPEAEFFLDMLLRSARAC
uniref:IAG-nucleoside hydrolase n=1 Tax=Trypanosoma vivax TaxID=5699 RepID=UPI000035888C|nr:Chain A, IAG-nucleoside hydrolase [Trypanosoma vivax]1R4F_B Chain B, IAG-nucleoside hydrolase [Trypanosoma vivax]